MTQLAGPHKLRSWFDASGWQLDPADLRRELVRRGADTDTVVELLDEGADRRRAQPPASTPARNGSGAHPTPEVKQSHNVPPQNLEAEESVLGAMMISPGAIAACSELLQADGGEFYRESHAKIWRASLALYAKGEPVDAITLTDQLEETGDLDDAGGRVRLHELAALVPSSANAQHYARIVAETALLRGLIRAGGEIARLAWDRPAEAPILVDQAQQITYQLGEGRATDDHTEHVSVSLKDTWTRMSDRAESGSDWVGVPSGLHDLDALTLGFEPGNLIYIAARPSMGKSALLHTILANISVRQGLPTMLFTAEMSKHEVTQRLISREARINSQRLRRARDLDGVEWKSISTAIDVLSKAPFYHDDSGQIRSAYVRTKSRRLKQQHPDLALIGIDYIQLLSGAAKAENATQELTEISRDLKLLARELEVPIIVLSQLSRAVENRVDKRPILSDLRQSGALEQDADLVMFLYRDEYYHEDSDQRGIAECNLAKHRNGPTDMIKLAFQKEYARFGNLSREHA